MKRACSDCGRPERKLFEGLCAVCYILLWNRMAGKIGPDERRSREDLPGGKLAVCWTEELWDVSLPYKPADTERRREHPRFRSGYDSCKADLRDMLGKASMKAPESQLAVILAFLMDGNEI